ncbi:hypothetical protein [Paenibacillus whitsoniae]|uniref:Uncharacterized protein n=1 Tax=Paenibacillus whitsoniae TaxID=2496558 RepID=A0A430J6V4_9BACL|nr:hypothetical protein [Paenibacillus whitsoniae]RTE04849.1 hypothetical protein EJQ19_25915 [Paenibacillus whitsoniae]
MGKVRKAHIKKKRATAVLVSSAMAVAPLLFQPTYERAHANESYPPEYPVFDSDMLGDRTVSLESSQAIIDLFGLYPNARYSKFIVESDKPDVAINEPGYDVEGLLKIHPIAPGTATFTVKYSVGLDETEHMVYDEDQFQVTVISGNVPERKYDISDIIKKMISSPSDFTTADSVKGLMGGIKPDFLRNQIAGNHAPQLKTGNPLPTNFNVQLFDELELGDLSDYFIDPDGDELYVSYIAIPDSNGEYNDSAHIYNGSESDEPEWRVSGDYEGTSYFRLMAWDDHGGVADSATFSVTVLGDGNTAPHLNPNNVVASHFYNAGNGNKMFLGKNSEIDLNDVFRDDQEDYIMYDVEVEEMPSSSTSTFTRSYSLSSSKLSWDSFQTYGTVQKIKKIKAYDSKHLYTPTEVTVDIERFALEPDQTEPFPALTSMYQSIDLQDPEKTSSLVLNVDAAFGEDVNVGPTDIKSNGFGSVTAEVYGTDSIKFVAPTTEDPSINKIKVYAHSTDGSKLYLDDFNFKVVPLPLDAYGLSTSSIRLEDLYPDTLDSFYVEGGYALNNDAISVIDDLYGNEILFETAGAVSINAPEGTTVMIVLHPNNGARVYYVPFTKENTY